MRYRRLGVVEYAQALAAMKQYTADRDETSADELWLLQHPPVFTQGISGKSSHVLAPGTIPVIGIDRGGQVTYHGPGQWVVYVLLDLRRAGLGVRDLVTRIEQSVISVLALHGIEACSDPLRPGVYVDGQKIASLGLKITRGCSYHGVALNVDMDLEPFQRINPCGYAGLRVTAMRELLGGPVPMAPVGEQLLTALERTLTQVKDSDSAT